VADVRHATAADLRQISDLLAQLRKVDGLVERSPGVFSRRSRAFLHFHEDSAELFADVRLFDDDFVRLRVTTTLEQARLLQQVAEAVGAGD
jgi:N-acetylglutamate synthase-like GNAT family acetyltransferase